jgi:sporulation protein YlmC with PRC-barrel domain
MSLGRTIMWKATLAAGMLAFMLGSGPAFARPEPEVPAAEATSPLYGLAVFTSDGVQIGAVTDTGTDEDGQTVLLAEVGLPLGLGTETVAIPLDLVALKGDRIDLTLTESEVRDILTAAARNKASEV